MGRENETMAGCGKATAPDRVCDAGRHELLPMTVWRNRHTIIAGQGQGTVEYAILVGILVVIAILAITVFRPKIQELWDAIASGINGL